MNFQEAISRLLLPATTTPEWRDHAAIIQASKAGTNDPDRTITYGQLETLVDQAAEAFANSGVKRQDAVLLCSPNSPELVAAILATWKLGALAIPVDFRLTLAEIENVAMQVSARIVYAPEKITDKFPVIDKTSWPTSPAKPKSDIVSGLDPDRPALVILTSGTTGIPKGALHDLKSLSTNIQEIGKTVGLNEDQSAMLPLPLSHIFGLEVMLAGFSQGSTIIFADFVPLEFVKTVTRLQPTMMMAVPTIYSALINMPITAEPVGSINLFMCGGAPLSRSLADEFTRKFNRRITQGYGTTETKIITINTDGPVESIGRPVPSSLVEIVDENDQVLAEGESGEIRIAGPLLMQGYLNLPEETKTVLHDNHYHTGDIGYIRDGYVFISGRLKEMIICAGNKIFPSEVEAVLRQHPLVSEVAVLGVSHRRLGQLVKAIIVVKPGTYSEHLASEREQIKQASQELESKLRDFCKQNLKRELRPLDWEFRSASNPLPKTHTGKIDKKQLETAPVS